MQSLSSPTFQKKLGTILYTYPRTSNFLYKAYQTDDGTSVVDAETGGHFGNVLMWMRWREASSFNCAWVNNETNKRKRTFYDQYFTLASNDNPVVQSSMVFRSPKIKPIKIKLSPPNINV